MAARWRPAMPEYSCPSCDLPLVAELVTTDVCGYPMDPFGAVVCDNCTYRASYNLPWDTDVALRKERAKGDLRWPLSEMF